MLLLHSGQDRHRGGVEVDVAAASVLRVLKKDVPLVQIHLRPADGELLPFAHASIQRDVQLGNTYLRDPLPKPDLLSRRQVPYPTLGLFHTCGVTCGVVRDLARSHTLPEDGAHGGANGVLGGTSPIALLGLGSKPILNLLTCDLLGATSTENR